MNLFKYTVYFHGGNEILVVAGCAMNAVILACAKRIEQGLHLQAYQVKCHHDNSIMKIDSLATGRAISVNWN